MTTVFRFLIVLAGAIAIIAIGNEHFDAIGYRLMFQVGAGCAWGAICGRFF